MNNATTPSTDEGVALMGDKGYDSDAFIQAIQAKGMHTVIRLATIGGLPPVAVIGLYTLIYL